jgi:hypothetical protein
VQRNTLAATLTVIAVLAGTGVTFAADRRVAPEAADLSRARVQVRVYDTTVMPAADQKVALRAATGVLAAAGIDVTWLSCDGQSAGGCDVPLERGELSVRFVRLAASPSKGGVLQLGYSLVDTSIGEGALATVYVDRVQWLSAQAAADTPTVLGFAVAHEIGHLLLGTNAHAASGLMRAVWTRSELQHAQLSDWLFSPGEGASMRHAVRLRQLQMAANIDWGR